MDELIKNAPSTPHSEDAYRSIRGYVIEAQRQVYTAVNAAMVTAYWNIGKAIYESWGGILLMASRYSTISLSG